MLSVATPLPTSGTLLGSVVPRLATPPLRDLTDPAATYGHEVIRFAREVLGRPLEPWQEEAVIRAGEYLPDNLTPRFKRVLLVVSRQSGKTHLCSVLAAFWLYVEEWPMVLGLHDTLSMASESWQESQDMVLASPLLENDLGRVYRNNNDMRWVTPGGQRYKIAAKGRKAGRGLRVDRMIIDELRNHADYTTYSSAIPAMSARPLAQAWLISNQGDEKSKVLIELRKEATDGIKGGESDPELCLLEWSAPEDAEPDDPAAIVAACPRLGRADNARSLASYLGEARASMRAGGEKLAMWKTEYLCQFVNALDPAIEPAAWGRLSGAPSDFADLRGRVALCVDVSPSQQAASVYAAAVQTDGRVRVGCAWFHDGPGALRRLRAELPQLVGQIKPRAVGWFPSGPAAAVAADLKDRSKSGQRFPWPPPGVTVEEIRGELAAVCMGLAEQVVAGSIWHTDDPRLNEQAGAAAKRKRGEGWVFDQGEALYAAAGAVHLARTRPPGLGKPMVVLPTVR